MRHRRLLRGLFYANALIVVALLGYKGYLNYALPEFEAEHQVQLDRIDSRLPSPDRFEFVVVGNISNSVGIFEKRLIPRINQTDPDFLISAGNAVSGGGEDKYQALHGSLQKLDAPYLLTFGPNEEEDFGSYRFYEHFGAHYYSFRLNDTRFIFIDTTGKTPWQWQLRWLENLLAHDSSSQIFLFTGTPLLDLADEEQPLIDDAATPVEPEPFRKALRSLIEEHDIGHVFSAGSRGFADEHRNGTRHVATGGAGGILLENDYYHYLVVSVDGDEVSLRTEALDTTQHPVHRTLESLWSFIYSLFYVGYLNFILLVSFFIILAIKLYNLVFEERSYVRDYDRDPTPWLDRPLRVAMFTNNYLPFIGGVPLSIERLKRGLLRLGDRVLVVAPRYREASRDEDGVLRLSTLLRFGGEFRMANLFAPWLPRRIRDFRPDIVHLHHPFWVGSLGLFIARRLKRPVVYTYHTRLEHYAHFVPLPGLLFRNLISHAIVRRFSNRCDGVIVPTASAEEYLRMIGVKVPTHIQPTGIDFDAFQQPDHDGIKALRREHGVGDETVLVTVSRLSNEKNLDFMLDAMAALQRVSTTPFRLFIIGDGHERDRLQGRIDKLGLTDRVVLVGPVAPERMTDWYHLGDLFVFASKSETQGMVILEAMAAGLPVVAVRSTGIDDVVRNEHNGYKTPERIELWRDRVRELLEDEDLRAEMAGNAREFAREHSIDAFAERTRAIYAEVLAGHDRNPEEEDR
ncbi:MAG: glycosyltransferase [Thiohalospira sp.]